MSLEEVLACEHLTREQRDLHFLNAKVRELQALVEALFRRRSE